MKIFLTGGNSRLGMLTVFTLLEKGHFVTASMRNPKTKNLHSANKLIERGARVVEIDVTDEASVIEGVNQAITHYDGIDVVVNNAGIFTAGPQEAFTAQDWLRVFEVNVFGAQRINRAVLPTMRQQNFGILIHISSLLGRFTLPYCAPYCASKQALEAMAEGYRRECAQFGVDSLIVEPGGFASPFFDTALYPSDTERLNTLIPNSAQSKIIWDRYKKKLFSGDTYNPQLVANAIANLLDQPPGQRPLRTVIDVMGLSDSINKINQELENFTNQLFSKMNLNFDVSIK